MTRQEAKTAITRAFKALTGWDLDLRPASQAFDHVAMVAAGAETPDQAAKAIYSSSRV